MSKEAIEMKKPPITAISTRTEILGGIIAGRNLTQQKRCV
jgi:hypothetical protein